MKRNAIIAAFLLSLAAIPVAAQDKSAATSAAEDGKKAAAGKAAPMDKRHSHMEERTGIRAKPSEGKGKPVDKSKHSHPRDR